MVPETLTGCAVEPLKIYDLIYGLMGKIWSLCIKCYDRPVVATIRHEEAVASSFLVV